MAASPVMIPDTGLACPLPIRGALRLPALRLACGVELPAASLAWQDWGPRFAPIVLVLGGISAGRDIGAWWASQCGVGKALDPRHSRLVSVDWLGGADASTGPAEGDGFPPIDSADQAQAILALLNHLGIARVAGIVGASYGGCVAQHLAVRLGSRLTHLVVLSAAHRASPWALALRTLQRAGIEATADVAQRRVALTRARQLAVLAYRTPQELEVRFGQADPQAGVLGWLAHHGERFAARFPPAAFLCLSASLDAHRSEPEAIRTPTTLVAVREDLLVPPALIREFAGRLGAAVDLVEIGSHYGHDAFLKEDAAIARVLAATCALEQAA